MKFLLLKSISFPSTLEQLRIGFYYTILKFIKKNLTNKVGWSEF